MIDEFLKGFGILIAYFIACASGALLLRRLVILPKEVFRKTLHFILLCSVFVWVYAYHTWWVSVLAVAAFVALVYPLLALAERIPGYAQLLTERKGGEIKRSFLIVFGVFALLIALCWGWFGEKWLVLACIFAWGFGDAAAALVGKKFGKRHLEGRHIEGRKSVEGTLAMLVVSYFSVLIVLLASGQVAWHANMSIAAITALVCTLTELYTRNGMDTLTCPLAAAAVILPLVSLWSV